MTAKDILTIRLEKLQDDYRNHSDRVAALQNEIVHHQEQLAMHKGAILVVTELISQLPAEGAPEPAAEEAA